MQFFQLSRCSNKRIYYCKAVLLKYFGYCLDTVIKVCLKSMIKNSVSEGEMYYNLIIEV